LRKEPHLKAKAVLGIVLTLLLTSMLASAFFIERAKAELGTIYIRADGSVDPVTAPIKRDGDTYTFTDSINGSTVSVERDNIVVDGAGYALRGTQAYGSVGMDLWQRTNVTIKNTQIESFNYGLLLNSSSSSVVSEDNITDNIFGLWLTSSSGNSISENSMTANNEYGILLDSSCSNDDISGNSVANNGYGISLTYSSNNSLSGNNITTNSGYGILLDSSSNNSISGNTFTDDGLTVSDSHQNSVENNTVNGKPLVYLEGVANYSVLDAGQVILVRCDSVRVENLNLSRASVGVQIWETSDSVVSGNNITANSSDGISLYSSSSNNSISRNNIANNAYGVLLDSSLNSVSGNNIANNGYGISLSSSSNNISGNSITENSVYGIWLIGCSSNSISGNNITANNDAGISLISCSGNSIAGNNIAANSVYGISLSSSFGNKIYHNSFVNNPSQVSSSESANVWDDGYPSGGNYWSDYKGTDVYRGPYQDVTGSDGIGDTTYFIDVNNQDRYPLMSPNLPLQNQTIHIRADGGVEPSDSPILQEGDLYTLTDNITCNADGIVIERDNMMLNGAGHTLQGIGANPTTGIDLSGRTNVTIKNTQIENFSYGIWLGSSSSSSMSGNNITANSYYGIWLYQSLYNNISENSIANSVDGIMLSSSSNNSVSRNSLTNNRQGMWLDSSSSNSIVGNNITTNSVYGILLVSSSSNSINENNVAANSFSGIFLGSSSSNNSIGGNNVTANNSYGIWLVQSSSDNSVTGNNIANNYRGIDLEHSSNNTIYHNSFRNNHTQVVSTTSENVWDDGYPSGGNWWSDYNGTDANGDGIGDEPYIVDANNTDRNPLMGWFSDFNATPQNHVQTICNSTISDFNFNGTAIVFNVLGENGAAVFCRICIPTALMNATYRVFVNGTEVACDLLLCSNATHSYLYFTYHTSTQVVTIIPEFSTWAPTLLTIITLTVATLIHKRRHLKTRVAA
jgi:parallel beta-helix repeat protein